MTRAALVTGAYGFLGRNVAKKLKANGYKVFACGHGDWVNDAYKEWGIDRWFEGDIGLELLKQFDIELEFIVHCAGSGYVGLSLENPELDFKKTVTSTLAVLEYIRRYSPRTRLVYPSSAAVYGKHDDSPIHVSDPLQPVSPYGVHKKIAEELCLSYAMSFDIYVSIIRFFSVYGPGLRKQLLWDAANKFVNDPNNVFWGSGNETRDWIYIADATELILAMATVKADRPFVIVNGAGGKRHTVKETLAQLAAKMGIGAKNIDFNQHMREGDPKFYYADIDDALKFGWSPKFDLSLGLENYVNWFERSADD